MVADGASADPDVIAEACAGHSGNYRPALGRNASENIPIAAVPEVLVVEDDALLAMELEQTVQAFGYKVIGPARSLAEAVQLAAGEPRPDAAVLDVNLAGDMVFPAADIFATRGVPVLFATGHGSATTLAGRNVKAITVLRKPYPAKLLGDALCRALLPDVTPARSHHLRQRRQQLSSDWPRSV